MQDLDDLVAVVAGRTLDAVHQLGEVGAGEVGHADADKARLTATQTLSEAVGLVAKRFHGLKHAQAQGLADTIGTVQRVRYGCDRDAALSSHVVDGGTAGRGLLHPVL
jgi:hypothetical protein